MTDEHKAMPEGTAQNSGNDEMQSGSGAASACGGADPSDLQARCAELEARCAELEARGAELHDQLLRAVAEVENVRRRSNDEVAKAHKYGIESFAEALLPVRDSLELALASESPSIENMKEGVDATLRLLANVFEKNRLLVVDPAGQKFDPNLHQAISMVPGNSANPPVAANHVVSVLQKGYMINDRVLRPALVTVAQG
jgi:molecular chaperone GrpE